MRRLLLAALPLVLLATSSQALATFPYPDGPTQPQDLYLGAGEVPGDLEGDEEWMYSATPADPGNPQDPLVAAVNANPAELFGVRGAHIADADASVDTAWQVTTGRPEVAIAVLDSGIKWDDEGAMNNLRFKTHLNPGELPRPRNDGLATPNEPGEDCNAGGPYANAGEDDLNGDGVFNLLDYACDSRVAVNSPNGVGPADMLEPQDLLIAFSRHTDNDENGYVDDIVGWDFLDDDNDPYDDVQYGHGTGEAKDSTAEADNGQGGAGTCPNCMAMHMRVGDSFIADVNRFAGAVTYAVDNGALVIQEALGTMNNSKLARDAVEYSYRHGVTVIASAADEAAQHNNWPSSLPHVVMVNSVTEHDTFSDDVPEPLVEQPPSYLKFNGCTNFYAKMSVAIPSVSCSSDATGRGSGIAGLIYSAALNAIDRGKLEPHPDCKLVSGEPCPITANEVRQLMASGTIGGTGLADDVDFSQDPEPSCHPAPAPDCMDPFLGRGVENPTLLPVVTIIPQTKRYPARGGHDQFYGWGRANVSNGVNALMPRPFTEPGVKSQIPPEVEITSPDWYSQHDPARTALAISGEVYARGAPYTCQVYVAPGHYPNNRSTTDVPPGDFKPVPSPHCDGTSRTESFSGALASLDLADLKSRFPAVSNDFTGREPGLGVQTSSGRPNTAPYGFVVKVVATTTGTPAMTGEDRRAMYLHRDAEMLDGFPLKLTSDGESSPAFADLDGDNRNELILGSSDGSVHAYTYDPGTGEVDELDGWPVQTDVPGFVQSHLASDAYSKRAGEVPTDVGGAVIAGVAVGDADRDGVPEVYAADLEGKVYGWNPDGARVFEAESNPDYSGKPLSEFVNVRKGPRNRTQHGFLGSPVLADLDQDDGGKLEIIAAAMDRHVYAWEHTGDDAPGFPTLVVDESKVASVDSQTHAVTFDGDAGPALNQGAIVDTPAVGDIAGDARPEIIVGTNEEYAVGEGDEGGWNVAQSSAPALTLLEPAGLLDFANGRVYAISPDGDPDAPASGESPFVAGWPVPIGIAFAELLPVVGEGINGSPVIAPLECSEGGAGPKVGTMPAAGPAYLLNADGTSCFGEEEGRHRTFAADGAGLGEIDRPVLPAVGLPAFGDLGGSQPSMVAPAAGVIRALDLGLNEYQTGGQDFVAAWDTSDGQFMLGWPAPVNDLQFLTGPAVGDVGGVPGEEVVAGTASMDLAAIAPTGSPTSPSWPKLSTDWTIATPLLGTLGTLDTDAEAQRVVVGVTRSGYINAYSTDADPCAPASSPRFHHDNANSGDYRRDAVLPGTMTLVRTGDAIEWTAPGDDLLCGTATSYEIVTSDEPIDGDNFDEATPLAGPPTPAAPGSPESYTPPAGEVERYVAIRAVDEQGNVGRVALIAYLGPPPGPCENLIPGSDGADTLTGTAEGDRMEGGDGDDELMGEGGEDCVLGQGGADQVSGGGAEDLVRGGGGDDVARGGTEDDRVRGGPGRDRVIGGTGDDNLKDLSRGRDFVNCGPGEDTALVRDDDDVVEDCETVETR